MGLPVPQGLTFGRTSPWGCSPGSQRGRGGPRVSPLECPGCHTRCAPVSPVGVLWCHRWVCMLHCPRLSPRLGLLLPYPRSMSGAQLLLPLHPQLLRASEGGSWVCTEEPLEWTGRAQLPRGCPCSWGRGREGWESCLGPATSAAGASCGNFQGEQLPRMRTHPAPPALWSDVKRSI